MSWQSEVKRKIEVEDRPLSFNLLPVADAGGAAELIDPLSWEATDTWAGVVGPSATLLWHKLVTMVGQPQPVYVEALGSWAGLSPAMTWHALDRLVRFGRATWADGDRLAIVMATRPARPRTRRA